MELPWECVVPGVPASLQGSSRKRSDWRARVAEAAFQRWPSGRPPATEQLAATMIFFHTGQAVDVDNMLKPTLDGLEGIAYDDDRRVVQVNARRADLEEGLRLRSASSLLVAALSTALADGQPFVYVRLSMLPDLEDLLR